MLNNSSPNSYFFMLVFPTSLHQWKPSVSDCLASCSEERERLIKGADEQTEEEREKSRPGNLKFTLSEGPIITKNVFCSCGKQTALI